jgi:CRISPR-associated protein Csb1
MDFRTLQEAVASAAAIRRRQRLQPAGGPGDKIFPPTYPGEGKDDPARHVLERRRIGDKELHCVLIDSVQSQANRLEEALLAAAEAGRIRLPRLVVDFPGAGLNSVGAISSLQAPHRIFDAILRDSRLNGVDFRESDLGTALKKATPKDATAILQACPTSLLFGVWNSTGDGGGLGAKFARAIVSEVIGVDVPVEETGNRRTGEGTIRTAARRTGSRIDPLGIISSVEVFKVRSGWGTDRSKLAKDAKAVRPSEINHGNIRPDVGAFGVTCDYAQQTLVITLAGLRRLRFGGDAARDHAARTYLAALGLCAALEGDRAGYALRSRCDLVPEDGLAPLELIGFDGLTTTIDLDADGAAALHEQAFDAAVQAGFTLDPAPVILQPQAKLVELVRRSQDKALNDEAAPDSGE